MSHKRTIVAGSEQLTPEIVAWLKEHDCTFEEDYLAIIRLTDEARITQLPENQYSVWFPESLHTLVISLHVNVFETTYQLIEQPF